MLQHGRGLALSKVAQPAPQVLTQLIGHAPDTDPPRPSRQFPDSLLEPLDRLRGNTPLGLPVTAKAEPQKLPSPRPRHRPLRTVDLQLELHRNETADTRHHAFSGSTAAHVDVTV